MPDPAAHAVFLSYASQDAEAATRICAALRAGGVEVRFDWSERVGAAAWDAKIEKSLRQNESGAGGRPQKNAGLDPPGRVIT